MYFTFPLLTYTVCVEIDWQITCAQISRANRGDCNYVGNILMMLCLHDIFKGDIVRVDKNGNKVNAQFDDEHLTGCDQILLLYRDEARQLAKGTNDHKRENITNKCHSTTGKMVRINGKSFLMVGVFHMFLGDSPGRCLTFGICESSNHQAAPCHCCHVRLHSFGASIDDADLRPLRSNADFRAVFEANNNRAGLPNNETARILFQAQGIHHATMLGHFPGVYEYLAVAIDVSHIIFLGEWEYVMKDAEKLLPATINGDVLPIGHTRTSWFYESLSTALQSNYAKINARKACKQRFTTLSQWNALNGNGIKIFGEVILLNNIN